MWAARRWCRAIAVSCAALAAAAPRARAPQTLTLSVMEVLDQYDRNRDLAIGAFGGVSRVGTILGALQAEGDQWVTVAGPRDAPRRRLVAATFALEAAHAGLDYDWFTSRQLIEWACAELRRQSRPLPEERLWQDAALALIEGVGDYELLASHVGHVRSRFPDDPRILMARAYLATDFHIWPASEYVWDPTANILPPETIHRLEDGLANRATAAEAHVRLAYLDLMANQFEAAAGHLQAADRLTDDANLRYLSALFAGWAAMRQGRTDEAIAAYRRALGWRPTAQTGALALGAALYGRGQRDEASATVERALAHPGVDPWLDYGRGDFPSWSDLIARLRSSLK